PLSSPAPPAPSSGFRSSPRGCPVTAQVDGATARSCSGPLLARAVRSAAWTSGTLFTAHIEHRRIRLVAYGARLESVLGASPRGFESPILRCEAPESLRFRGFSLSWCRSWPAVHLTLVCRFAP